MSRRKFRLFSVACCRPLWQRLADSSCRRALVVAEQFADNEVNLDELLAAHEAIRFRNRHTVGYLMRLLTLESPHFGVQHLSRELLLGPGGNCPARRAEFDREQSDLYREIRGTPFRPVTIEAALLTTTVLSLARAAYSERQLPSGELDPIRLTVLADALEEAGAPGELLEHLRSSGPHFRGCWALDVVLGLS
jgi:hypothetical protein